MAVKTKKAQAQTNERKDDHDMITEVVVLRAREFDNSIAIDLRLNGITIYGCWYRTYKDKQTGEEKGLISFPSYKASNGKYYNHAYTFISPDTLEKIETQIEKILNTDN